MYKKYVYHEYNDANIRGVVDVNRHIRLNIPANGKIAYRTREFSYDNSVTQLIRHTIEFIRRKQFGKAVLHNDPDTEGCVQQIIQATPTFQPQQRQAIINENLRPVVHPYYTKYAALQNLCLRILRYEKLSYGNDSNNKIHGLLIDAAWLWEEYIGQVLSEDTDIKHYTRKNSHYHLFRDKDGAFQKIIPDYYDGDRIVADAKYIPLNRSRNLDADRAAPIYYKTIMYMYRFNTKKGFLFHPIHQNDFNEADAVSETYLIDERPDCSLTKIGLVVDGNAKTYPEFRDNMKKKESEFKRLCKTGVNT
jgi:5-methylcytosine-specific restriction endonuclease McrBC regulatory subunit McrC